jgi:hypothetical protein
MNCGATVSSSAQQPIPKETPMNKDRLRNAFVVVIAVGLTLVVAGPASAQPKKPPAQPAKKGCEIQLKGPGAGQSIVYPDGHSFSVQGQDNKTHTYTCNDGQWKETVSLTAGPVKWRNVAILVSAAGTLQAVQR